MYDTLKSTFVLKRLTFWNIWTIETASQLDYFLNFVSVEIGVKKVFEIERGYVLRGQHGGAGGDNNHLTPSPSSQYLSLPLVTQTYSSAFHFQQYLSVPPVSSPTLSLSHEYFLYEAEVPCGAFHFQKYWSNTVYTVYCFTIHVQCTSRSLLKYVLISEAVYQSLIWWSPVNCIPCQAVPQ